MPVSNLGKKAYLDCALDWNTNILQEFLHINTYSLPKHNIAHTYTFFFIKKKWVQKNRSYYNTPTPIYLFIYFSC